MDYRDAPRVSALCIGGRDSYVVERLLPVAIDCFVRQSYPADRRELVIVQDHPLPAGLLEHCRKLGNIRVLPRPSGARRPLGAMRNESLDAAQGQFCICWDADDWHHPYRMESQVSACVRHPGLPSFLMRALAYSFSTDTAFIRDYHSTPIHASICHPRSPHRYPDLEKGEDTDFMQTWVAQGRALRIDNDPIMYVRTEHGHNTWDQEHILRGFNASWALGRWHCCDEHRQFLRKVVLPCYPLRSAAAEIGR